MTAEDFIEAVRELVAALDPETVDAINAAVARRYGKDVRLRKGEN